MWWFGAMCLAAAMGFGLATTLITADPIIGFNVGFGVYFFLVSIHVGFRRALRMVFGKDE